MSEFMGLIYGNYEAKVGISVRKALNYACGVTPSLYSHRTGCKYS